MRGAEARPRWEWLRSQGLGVVCGLSTVSLLALGSAAIVSTRKTASKAVAMDDLTAFFREPSVYHAWLYLLIPVLALYALNALLATWHSVAQNIARRVRAPSAYAAPVMHLAFLLALGAHAIGGLWSQERGMVRLASEWRPMGDRLEGRLLGLELENHPNGEVWKASAQLELRDEGGSTPREEIGFNSPLSSGLGSSLFLLTRHGEVPAGVRLAIAGQSCSAKLGESCPAGTGTVTVLDIRPSGHWGNVPVAILGSSVGISRERIFLLQGQELRLESGASIRLEEISMQPAVLLRSRRAPGNPWALASALLLVAGMAMMGRRWL
ncbi:MAG: hypothetical protein HYZ28_04400 [Myxococcales bacterium]|nr:hypothetical protein [Myxococcales bacterium]